MNTFVDGKVLLEALWRASWQSAALVPAIMLVQALLRGSLSAGWRHGLWWIVVVRLLLPVTPGAPWSVFNAPAWAAKATIASEGKEATFPPRVRASIPAAGIAPIGTTAFTPSRVSTCKDATESGGSLPIRSAEQLDIAKGGGTASERWEPVKLLLLVWLLGVTLLTCRLVVVQGAFRYRLRNSNSRVTGCAAEVLADACRIMGIGVVPPLMETRLVEGPALHGVFRPHLLLPPGFGRALSREDVLHVMLHELAHLRRGDHLTHWVVHALKAVHWFNPVVWWVSRRMDADQEIACDALVLGTEGVVGPRCYGSTLLKLVSESSSVRPAPGTLGVIGGREELRRRIRMISVFSSHRRRPWLALTLLMGLSSLFLTDAQLATPEPLGSSPSAFPVGATVPESLQATNVPAPIQSGGIEATRASAAESLIGEGKVLYDMGRLDEAEAKFGQAKSLQADLEAPDYFLKLIAEKRYLRMRDENLRMRGENLVEADRAWIPPKLDGATNVTPNAATNKASALESRVFRLSPRTLEDALEGTLVSSSPGSSQKAVRPPENQDRPSGVTSTNMSEQIAARLHELFTAAGVVMSPQSGNHFYYSRGTGVLMVRASTKDLDSIQRMVELLNISPPQVMCQVKVIEVSSQAEASLAGGVFLGGLTTASTPTNAHTFTTQGLVGDAGSSAATPSPKVPTGPLLTPSETRGVFPSQGSQQDATATTQGPVHPSQTAGFSLQGNLTPAQSLMVLQSLERRGAMRTLFAPNLTTLSGMRTKTTGGGLTLNVRPTVRADGYSIDTDIECILLDPKMSISTRASIWDGQTLVLGCVAEPDKSQSNPGSNAKARAVMVLVTPTIVDSAGNAIHRPEAPPFTP